MDLVRLEPFGFGALPVGAGDAGRAACVLLAAALPVRLTETVDRRGGEVLEDTPVRLGAHHLADGGGLAGQLGDEVAEPPPRVGDPDLTDVDAVEAEKVGLDRLPVFV